MVNQYESTIQAVHRAARTHTQRSKGAVFFFPRVWPMSRERLGPYVSRSRKHIVQRTMHVQWSRQIDNNTQNHKNQPTRPHPQIPQPDLRFASGKTKQTAKPQKQHKKRGQSPTRTPTKSICRETQWYVHCLTRKNVPNELISRLSGKHEGKS